MSDTQDNNAVPATWEEVFQHPRFKQLIDARKQAEDKASKLEQDLATMKQDFESKLQDASKGPQDELGKLQAQLDALQEKYQTTEQSWKAAEQGRLRLQVAQELGIPDWADELKGETPDELKTHGAQILERIKARLENRSPGVPPRGNGSPTAAYTAAQMSDPEFVRKHQAEILAAAAQQ